PRALPSTEARFTRPFQPPALNLKVFVPTSPTMTDHQPSLLNPPLPAAGQQRAFWRAPVNSTALALAVAKAARAHAVLLVAITRDTHSAHALEAELQVFAGELPVLHFPDWETLPYDLFSPHADIVSQRIATLYRLPATRNGVLV